MRSPLNWIIHVIFFCMLFCVFVEKFIALSGRVDVLGDATEPWMLKVAKHFFLHILLCEECKRKCDRSQNGQYKFCTGGPAIHTRAKKWNTTKFSSTHAHSQMQTKSVRKINILFCVRVSACELTSSSTERRVHLQRNFICSHKFIYDCDAHTAYTQVRQVRMQLRPIDYIPFREWCACQTGPSISALLSAERPDEQTHKWILLVTTAGESRRKKTRHRSSRPNFGARE